MLTSVLEWNAVSLAITSKLFKSTFSIIHKRIKLTLVCRVFIIRFVMGCLEISRNDSGSQPFDPFIRYWFAKFFKADLVCVGWSKLWLFINFVNFVFKRLMHCVNHFWWHVIQQLFTKIVNLLHTPPPIVKKLCMFCLFFHAIFDGLPCVGYKTGVRSFGIDSSKLLLFCSTNLVAFKACINFAFFSL